MHRVQPLSVFCVISFHFSFQCSEKRLPEWGFQQYEVVTDRNLGGPNVLWGIDDLRPPNFTQGAGQNQSRDEEEREIRESLLRHARAPQGGGEGGGAGLSFWEKYFELQVSEDCIT